MINSAACLLDLVDAVRALAIRAPINPVTGVLLARILDGLTDYTALLAHEFAFKLPARPPLRLVATTDIPRPARRGRPKLKLIGERTR